jgi:hypothetical protein
LAGTEASWSATGARGGQLVERLLHVVDFSVQLLEQLLHAVTAPHGYRMRLD